MTAVMQFSLLTTAIHAVRGVEGHSSSWTR